MKRYRLKKDLPTFKAGETFELWDSIETQGLCRESDGVMAYHQKTLEKFPNILTDWFEEIPEHARWRADIGERYRYLDSSGTMRTTTEAGIAADRKRYELGNYFRTTEENEKARDWLKAFTVLRDDTKGFTPNWKDETEDKYFVAYDHLAEKLCVYTDFRYQDGIIYFRSREDAEASIKAHEKEWLTYLGVEDEK